MGVNQTNRWSYYTSKVIVYIGTKIFGASKKIANTIYQPQATLKDIGWVNFQKSGGETLRYDYELNKNSIIFDLGGYDGQFSSDLFARFGSTFFVFEAYKPYADLITHRFKFNDRINVFDFGLAAEDQIAKMSVDSVGSSTFIESSNMVDIHLKEAKNFMNTHEVNYIDLVKINIEGGEYELLEHLIDENLICRMDNLQIQFHNFVPNAYERMTEIRNKLALTHYPTYQFDFIWENWKRKAIKE